AGGRASPAPDRPRSFARRPARHSGWRNCQAFARVKDVRDEGGALVTGRGDRGLKAIRREPKLSSPMTAKNQCTPICCTIRRSMPPVLLRPLLQSSCRINCSKDYFEESVSRCLPCVFRGFASRGPMLGFILLLRCTI